MFDSNFLCRFRMLSAWLAFSAVLACSVNPRRTAVTVSPTYSVNGHLEKALTLECGTGNNTGQYLLTCVLILFRIKTQKTCSAECCSYKFTYTI